jgi:hypothetical protein
MPHGEGGQVAASLGFAMILVGAIVIINRMVVHVLRTPTSAELRKQDPTDSRTWHLSPRGLLLLLAVVGILAVINLAAGKYAPFLVVHVTRKVRIVDVLCVLLAMSLLGCEPMRTFFLTGRHRELLFVALPPDARERSGNEPDASLDESIAEPDQSGS